MYKTLKIRDITLRDGQQSLFFSAMTTADVERLIPLYRHAGFHTVEAWGGDLLRAMVEDLHENPWERLRIVARELEGASLVGGVSRGRNLFGMVPYPGFVIEGFYEKAFECGLNVMRVFDSLNDLDNIRSSIEMIKELGGIADGALVYANKPLSSPERHDSARKGLMARIFGLKSENPAPEIFPDEYYIEKAKAIEAMGADIVTIKDGGGVMPPSRVFTLLPKIKQAVKTPVAFHTHCTSGYGLASALTAVIKGTDILDTAIWTCSGCASGPSIELMAVFCHKMGIDIDVNMEVVADIRRRLQPVCSRLVSEHAISRPLPGDFESLIESMPKDIDLTFDDAITAASENREADLLEACDRIEKYFGIPEANTLAREHEIPAVMYAYISETLAEKDKSDLLKSTLEMVDRIRVDAGTPPLVMPSMKILADQAVLMALDQEEGKEPYSTLHPHFVALVKGDYGITPVEIAPEFREKITGSPRMRPYDVSSFRQPKDLTVGSLPGVSLVKDEEERLLLQMFPEGARSYLEALRRAEHSQSD